MMPSFLGRLLRSIRGLAKTKYILGTRLFQAPRNRIWGCVFETNTLFGVALEDNQQETHHFDGVPKNDIPTYLPRRTGHFTHQGGRESTLDKQS